jgi:fructosamine-3-kinase
VPGGPRVVRVERTPVAPGADSLDLERIRPVPATSRAAADLGSRLAVLHDAGASAWGAAPAGWSGDAWFGPLADPLPMATGAWDTWADFLADARLAPLAAQGLDRGALTPVDAARIAHLADRLHRWDTREPPARVHGDLWSGNVLWTRSERSGGRDVEAVLIDPAAHGGHREADLAMLSLFGAPHLDALLAGYDAAHPLEDGWRERVAVHQVYPVAVHAVLFGGGYLTRLRRMLDALLA